MQNLAAGVAQRLLQINAIKLSPQNPFTWASGMKSPIYCDNRIVLSYPEARTYIIEGFKQKASEFPAVDKIAGVATAGIPHGALLADKMEMPFIYVRSKAKGHGRQNQIEGELKPGEKVLVIEDLISTGGSCLKAVDALKESGAEVIGVMAIFTYGFQKAVDAFAQAGIPFATLSNYDVLVEEAVKANYVTEADIEILQEWRKRA
ncbi:MAG: orotate phosphoribosyltransferase [Saprospiraceae bacterium]